MKKFIAFPSIEAFRHTIYNVNRQAEFQGLDENEEPIINVAAVKPSIPFTGTVKLHGTNAGICYDGNELWAQSRKNIITSERDNAGFAFFVESRTNEFLNLMHQIKAIYNVPEGTTIAVYGEWCGGNIQKGVALNGLEKMFVIFKIKLATEDEEVANTWLKYNAKELDIKGFQSREVSFIEDYPTFEVLIDFNNPADIQNKLIELTTEVERECPVAKVHGVSGIGEGIVWSGTHGDNNYIFKVKGEKHSATKVKKLAAVDVEKLNNAKEFVDYALTENRLNQGIQEVFTVPNVEISKKEIKTFLNWVKGDIFKEEMDSMKCSGLEPKDVIGLISKKAVNWLAVTHGL